MADEIRRWSDELARDSSSLVFLQLGEALRRQGELEVALKIAVRGAERHPTNADAHDLVARIAVDLQDLPRAFDEWEAALQLAPHHVGAMKGLGYVCFQQGRFDDAERYLNRAAAGGGGTAVNSALATVRRTSGGIVGPADPPNQPPPAPPEMYPRDARDARDARDSRVASDDAPSLVHRDPIDARLAPDAQPAMPPSDDPQWLFVDLLLDDAQTALLLDASGLVLGGVYSDAHGADVSQEVGARLSGISDEVVRAAHHLDLGDWKSMTFETEIAVVAMAPAVDNSLIVVAASRATPLGLVRRLLDRCWERATHWLSGGHAQPSNGNGRGHGADQ